MTDTYRAALQKLLNEVHDLRLEAGNPSLRSAVTEARAALAEQPVGPTDEELEGMWIEQYGYTGYSPAMSILEFKDAARAVLARWGQS